MTMIWLKILGIAHIFQKSYKKALYSIILELSNAFNDDLNV